MCVCLCCLSQVEYFIELCDVLPELKGQVSHQQKERLREVYSAFSTADALEVKQIEAVRVKEGKIYKAIRGGTALFAVSRLGMPMG